MKKWLGLIFFIAIIFVGVKLWRISIPARSLIETYDQVASIRDNPKQADLNALQPMLHQAHLDLAMLQKELGPFAVVANKLGWLPTIGGDVEAAPELLSMGVALTEAGSILLSALDPVVKTVADSNQVDADTLAPVALETLQQRVSEFEKARFQVAHVQEIRKNIEVDALSPQIARQVERLDRVLPLSDLAFDAIQVMPQALGTSHPRTYLIIAQNNDELRPTGGFISAIGTVVIDQGKISSISFEDSYAIDDFSQPYPESPPQLSRYMLSEIWVARDANWSPDFPTSMNDFLSLYAISRDMNIDGVIAVDQLALQQIVRAFEPIQIADWPDPIMGDTVIDQIRQSWSPEGEFDGWDAEWWRNRKNFMGDLVSALRNKVETSPGTVNWQLVFDAMLKALDERHIQIWFADPILQDFVHKYGWDGALKETNNDYLMVVDANLGFNKVNAVMETTLQYDVSLTIDNTSEAQLTIINHNHSNSENPCQQRARYGQDYWELINRCYWNYQRVYTPLGSQLIEASRHPIAAQFLLNKQDEAGEVANIDSATGKSGWGTLLLVPHGQVVNTSFHYSLPSRIVSETDTGWQYNLYVQKQSGTQGHKLDVNIRLPQGSQVLTVSPDTAIFEETDVKFNLELVTDQVINITFQ